MARQMLRQHIAEEIAKKEEIQADKAQYNPDSARVVGCKYITAKQLQRDILSTNRFQKVKANTLQKLTQPSSPDGEESKGGTVLDKHRVKHVFQSLKHINAQIFKMNGLDPETTDFNDFIYLTIRMKEQIRVSDGLGESTRDVKTPIQLTLPHKLEITDALLLVKQGSKAKVTALVSELGLEQQIQVREFSEVFKTHGKKREEQMKQKLKKKDLDAEEVQISDYQVFMVDDTISRSLLSKANKIFKKRNYAFPVKLRGSHVDVKNSLISCLETTTLVMQGGHDFEIRVAQTVSMPTKEATKNIMHTVIRAVSLILYAAKIKHNSVQEIFLSTTKSKPLPIFEQSGKANEQE